MTRKQRRLALIGAAGAVLCVAAGLVLVAMRDTIVFFYGPTEIAEKGLAPGTRMRLGGLVEKGSVERGPGQRVAFCRNRQQDYDQVTYEGCCRICSAKGRASSPKASSRAAGRFRADSVLAKHDETYMPREVADALKKQGHWQPEKLRHPTPLGDQMRRA
jgi:cytochrome c-type biogenesis protein CcmE